PAFADPMAFRSGSVPWRQPCPWRPQTPSYADDTPWGRRIAIQLPMQRRNKTPLKAGELRLSFGFRSYLVAEKVRLPPDSPPRQAERSSRSVPLSPHLPPQILQPLLARARLPARTPADRRVLDLRQHLQRHEYRTRRAQDAGQRAGEAVKLGKREGARIAR